MNVIKKLEIETLDPMKFYSLCRSCLTENPLISMSLFSPENSKTLAEIIMSFTEVNIKYNDGLPSKICDQCYKDLLILSEFRNKCHNADTFLREIYCDIVSKNETLRSYLKPEDNFPLLKHNYEYNKDDDPQWNDDGCGNSPVSACTSDDHREKVKHVIQNTFLSADLSISNKTKTTLKVNQNVKIANKFSIPSNNEVKLENTNKTDYEQFVCDICRKSLKHKKSLEIHIQNVHNEEKRKRDIGRVTGYGAEREYHCTECSYSTRYKIDLVIHMRRHTGEKPYQCKICRKCFAQQSTLNNHLKTHSDTMYFTCPYCGKQFKYKYKYEKHKNSHTQEQRFYCTICHRGLKSPKILEEHMNRHYNIKNYNCETCGSTFVTFSEMSIHSRIHGTEKRFKCHLCDYRTFVKASLEKHVRRHTGERPYVCEVCQWKCYTRGELTVHSRTHTKEKNYSCPVCKSSFKTSSALNKHVIRTHGIKYKWSDHKDRRIIK